MEMRVTVTQLPLDLILCLVGSLVLVPLALLNVENPVRFLLGVPFLLFVPGYVLVFALFPFKRQRKSISFVERIALSLGASVAIVPLVGLALNYSPWGINLQPLLLLMIVFIFGVGVVAFYRWFVTVPEERFCVSVDVSFPSFENKVDKVLTLVLAVLMITSVVLLVYVIVVPRVGERFTEFSILGVNGTADQYPQNLSIRKNASSVNVSVIIGITNHEYRDITYTVQVWLVNQTTRKNETVINHMWLLYENEVKLNHTSVNLDNLQGTQWENNTTFSVNRTGFFKLVFLLFTTSPGNYISDVDYREKADQIMDEAYRSLHLWVNVNNRLND